MLFSPVVLGCKFLWDDDYRRDFEYKQGMLLDRRLGKGRLAIAGGTRSGQMFSMTSNNGYNATLATPQGGRTIGAVITRTKG